MLAVRTRHFAAQAWRREDFARIAQLPRIEGRTHALHRVEILGREHLGHRVSLVGADTVFTGDRASGFNAVGEDFVGHFHGAVGLPRHTLVITNQGMEVAVARVKDVANAEPRPSFEIPNTTEHLGEPRPGYDAVLNVVVRRHAAHGSERGFPSPPNSRALLLVGSDFDAD